VANFARESNISDTPYLITPLDFGQILDRSFAPLAQNGSKTTLKFSKMGLKNLSQSVAGMQRNYWVVWVQTIATQTSE
jgi:hypothetical protein